MINHAIRLEGWVPIGADWDPSELMFYLTYLCGIGVGPGPVLIHT